MQASIAPRYNIHPARRFSAKAKRRARTFRMLIVLLVAAFVLVFAPKAVFTMAHTSAPAVEHYTVRTGDTLWEIADQYTKGGDVRDTIYAIKQANHLQTATVIPGQVLAIPQTGR